MAKGIKLKPQAKFGGLYKVCPKCGEDKPLEMFARDLSKSDGVTSHCKQCRNDYRKTPHASALHRKQAREYYHRGISPEKKRCAYILHELLRHGLKKGLCEICGATENIQAHHPDYTDPFNIVWLCKRCHSHIHREEKRT